LLVLIDGLISQVRSSITAKNLAIRNEITFRATVTAAYKTKMANLASALTNNGAQQGIRKKNAADALAAAILKGNQLRTAQSTCDANAKLIAATRAKIAADAAAEAKKQANYDAQVAALKRILEYLKAKAGAIKDNSGDALDELDVDILGDWRIGVWTDCSTQCGPGTQTRKARCIGGNCPKPAPILTKACNLKPCRVNCVTSAWSAWSACDRSCGTGTQTQARSIITPAAHGGTPCPSDMRATRRCNTHACPAPPIIVRPAAARGDPHWDAVRVFTSRSECTRCI
jgi:hypothetical protein